MKKLAQNALATLARLEKKKTAISALALLLIASCAYSGTFTGKDDLTEFSNDSLKFSYPSKGVIEYPPMALEASISYAQVEDSSINYITLAKYDASSFVDAYDVVQSWAERFNISGPNVTSSISQAQAANTQAALLSIKCDTADGMVSYTGIVPLRPIDKSYWMLMIESKPYKGLRRYPKEVDEAIFASLQVFGIEGGPLSVYEGSQMTFAFPYTEGAYMAEGEERVLLEAFYADSDDTARISALLEPGFDTAEEAALSFYDQAIYYKNQATISIKEYNGFPAYVVETTGLLPSGMFETKTTIVFEKRLNERFAVLQFASCPKDKPRQYKGEAIEWVLGTISFSQ